MKKRIIFLISIISMFSCKSKLLNQTVERKREGIWIEKYSMDSAQYKSIGKYRNDDPIKKWRYYLDGKIIKREKHKGNGSFTRFYHQNGKIQSQGKTVLDTCTKYAHWYYSGSWNFYNTNGKMIMKRNYDKGKLVSETILK